MYGLGLTVFSCLPQLFVQKIMHNMPHQDFRKKPAGILNYGSEISLMLKLFMFLQAHAYYAPVFSLLNRAFVIGQN